MLTFIISIITAFASGLYFKHKQLNNYIKSLTSSVEVEDESEIPFSYFHTKPKNINITDKYYITLRSNINVLPNVSQEHKNSMLNTIFILFLLRNKFLELTELNLMSDKEAKVYIASLDGIIKVKFIDCYNDFRAKYNYSGNRQILEIKEQIESFNTILSNYTVPKPTPIIKTPTVLKDVTPNNKFNTEILSSIEKKHLKIDNVISNSLFINAKTLDASLSKDNKLDSDDIEVITSQLNQIESFLDKEITLTKTETKAEFHNRLKANQRYLDSLEINWVSEGRH